MRKIKILIIALALVFLTGCSSVKEGLDTFHEKKEEVGKIADEISKVVSGDSGEESYDLSSIPEFDGSTAYAVLNENKANFTNDEIVKGKNSFEEYSELDSLGRCGVAIASVGRDIMPTEERGSIGMVKPSGWVMAKYDIVDGKYLYNRCHLIGYQLTGENANTKNLITGTRYLNIDGMLGFENAVADYVENTGNHVLYRVTPVFQGNELVARGVQMEAYSVEDSGKDINFNVYCYNVQPGVSIDYATGNSELEK